ncbi:MAG: hypothetical protein ACOH2A_11470 [Sphingobacteriaceae bacterium]
MMIKTFFQVDTAIGVSVHLNADGTLEIQACKVALINKLLNFEQKLTGLKSLQELAYHFPENAAVSINLNGKGILHKQVAHTGEINATSFSKILPNASISDFYVQHFLSGTTSFVSVVRIAEANQLLKQFRDHGFEPLQLSLGAFPIETILPQLNVYNGSLVFAGYHAERNEAGEWLSCRYQPGIVAAFPFKIEQELIEEKLLTAYAGAFQFLFGDRLEIIQAVVPELDASYKKLRAVKKVKAAGMMVLGILFSMLLINFLAFFYLDSANSKLAAQVTRSAQSRLDFGQTESQIKTKEDILTGLGWDGGVDKAFILDQLAASLPPEITWEVVSLNPVDLTAGRNLRTLIFADRQIHITGFAGGMLPVNEWMAGLKGKSWLKSVQLESYILRQEDQRGQFLITIKY